MSRLLVFSLIASLLAACGGDIQTLPTPQPSIFQPGAPTAQPALPGQPTPVQPGQPTPVEPGQPGQPTPGEPTGPGHPTDPSSPVGHLIAATVQIQRYEQRPGGPEHVSNGSGTIISRDGLIVTNAHVAAPDAPGLPLMSGEIGSDPDPAVELRVLMTEREDEPPVPRYKAEAVAVDGYLDIAVIRIISTIDNQPVTDQLPSVPLGDSDALRIGDRLTVVGFPGIGGDTVSANLGDVSGFLEDRRIGPRGWIKTSAIVHSGNSGGLAANAAGELIGVPTLANTQDVGGYSQLRPVKLAMPVIQAAQSGQGYGPSPYFHPGTGQEQAQFVGWLSEGSTDCAPANLVTGYPTGTSAIRAAFRYSGFTSDVDFGYTWFGLPQGTQQARALHQEIGSWDLSESGECLYLTLGLRTPFPDGTYGVMFGAGPHLRLLARGEVAVGVTPGPGPVDPGPGIPTPAPGTPDPGVPATPGPGDPSGPADWILLGGRVIDATSGVPVAGAFVVALRPGVDPLAWYDDPNADDADVMAAGVTGQDGTYVLSRRLPPSTPLPLLVFARGYAPVAGTLTTGTRDGLIGDIAIAPATP